MSKRPDTELENMLKSLLVKNAVIGKKNAELIASKKENPKPKKENLSKPK